MLDKFLQSIGLYADHTFCAQIAYTFWQSPVGLFCSAALVITSAIRLLHPNGRQGFFDAVWHMVFAFTAAAAFTKGITHGTPTHLIKTLVVLITIRGIYKAYKVFRHA